MTLLNRSRPSWSVPIRFTLFGELRVFEKSVSSYSKGAIYGAAKAMATISKIIKPVMNI